MSAALDTAPTMAIDPEGFLVAFKDWTPMHAEITAASLSPAISLSAQHWHAIFLIQNFYRRFDLVPTSAAFARYARQCNAANLCPSMSIRRLFGVHGLTTLARLAGLPKPQWCFTSFTSPQEQ